MKVFIKVKPNARENRIEKLSENEFILRVKAAAIEGRANEAARKCLSEYFDVAKRRITIIKGHKSKNKIIHIE